jgi:hypothetical protein
MVRRAAQEVLDKVPRVQIGILPVLIATQHLLDTARQLIPFAGLEIKRITMEKEGLFDKIQNVASRYHAA